jgi:transposase
MTHYAAHVGLDVHKESISVAIAEAGRDGDVRMWGSIPNETSAIEKLAKKLVDRHHSIEFVYEAGPCGYAVHRTLTKSGVPCRLVAPSHTPRRPGDRIKNDTRDALMLAKLLRAGELTFVWVPDTVHEAMRDVVRARQSASYEVRKARQRIQTFLLKLDRRYDRKCWGYRHRIWLANQKFDHDAQQIAFQSYLNAHEQAQCRRAQLDEQIQALLPQWSLAPMVDALQALKGIGQVIAVAIFAYVGDFTRFKNPRELMAYVGLVPGERSSGDRIRKRGITRAGNSDLRSLVFEAAWCYRTRPKVGSWMEQRLPTSLGPEAKSIAWKAQLRLHSRYCKLVARGKKSQVAITAVARELLGFVWAIAKLPLPQSSAVPRDT